MARTLRGYGLSAVLAAVDRRPALRGSRLVASAVLALRALYGDRKICALRGHDRCAAVVLSWIVFVLNYSAYRVRERSFHIIHHPAASVVRCATEASIDVYG